MAQRTSIGAVQKVLGSNYGPDADGADPDLQQFIDAATEVVDQVVNYAALRRPAITHTSTLLEKIERWLAAYFYCLQDPLYISKSVAGRSGSMQRAAAVEGFESNDYGKAACRLDYSGVLVAIGKRQVASVDWLGKVPTDQIDAADRDS